MINQDIEASVIGGLLIGGLTPDASEVLGTMDAEDFATPLYRQAFVEIKRQAKQRSLIDSLLVAEAMGENFANIMETMRVCPGAANLKGYAKIVSEYAVVRNFLMEMDVGRQRVSSSGNHEIALSAVRETLSKLNQIDRPSEEFKPVHIKDILEGYHELLEKRLTMGEESDTLKTGIAELDEITGGINPVDFVVVAARPGMGKTEFALTVAEGVARQKVHGSDVKRSVLIFTMEMDANQIVERQIAGAGNIAVSSLRKPSRMRDEDWNKVTVGLGKILELDIWIVDASKLTVEQIRAITERHKQKHPALSLVMVDYLGLIEKPKAERNDLAIAHISGSLKRMAKDVKTPVMSLSQLSRDVEKRPNKRPVNADLRDSGSVEQDADSIVMLYRDVVYNESSTAAEYAEIIVTKNRFGQLGTVYQRFTNGHFKPCNQEEARIASTGRNNDYSGRRYAKAADV